MFDETEFEVRRYTRGLGRSPNADPVEDPFHKAFPFKGTIESGEAQLNGFSGSTRATSDDLAPRPVVETFISALAACWPWTPKAGDRIIRIADGERFEISYRAGGEDGSQRVTWRVTKGS